MKRSTGVVWLLYFAFVAAAGAESPDAANLEAAKVAAALATTIKSWKPLPGEQFEVAGRKTPVIRPEKERRGESGARLDPRSKRFNTETQRDGGTEGKELGGRGGRTSGRLAHASG